MNDSTPRILPRGLQPRAISSNANGENLNDRGAAKSRILVIDDDSEIRELIADLLRGAAYRVDTAGDGGAGWFALCANDYDLLITDHMMPKITGLELVRRLRAVSRALPCILISGAPPWHETDLTSLLRPGAVVEKPFALCDLLAKAQELLAGVPPEQATATTKVAQPNLCEA